jgi:hypothetical protein
MSLKNPVTPLGLDPGTVRRVAQRPRGFQEPNYKSSTKVELTDTLCGHRTHILVPNERISKLHVNVH